MLAKDILRRNKTALQQALCADYQLILDKVLERSLITQREYNNLKKINGENVEGHVVALVDKIMNKGEDTCRSFLDLLQTDEQIKTTYDLKNTQISDTSLLPTPVQVASSRCDDAPASKKQKKDEVYELKSKPVGLCVIINNKNFHNNTQKTRNGTDKDARSLAEVFTWLGFRVLACKDQTSDRMRQVLKSFASLGAGAQPQGLSVEEWSEVGFTAPQQDIKHGDAFFCCILSHGVNGSVLGTDSKPVNIKEITRTFKATEESALTGKPKIFLIQACQGNGIQKGVLLKDVEIDG
ncbi:caspase-8 [Austrofundulus limnaeus]|uniref:Caspase-8 n=1 Tax=Austrofundulus limnaeus TaxID=52670 RepID=A0A2I4AMB2_AUSLI|nr:PREDICTED: caspase-8-like [Austrofundulus limnaeus]